MSYSYRSRESDKLGSDQLASHPLWSDRLWTDEEGQDIAEYSVMLAVILVIVVGTVRLIGSNAGNISRRWAARFSRPRSEVGSIQNRSRFEVRRTPRLVVNPLIGRQLCQACWPFLRRSIHPHISRFHDRATQQCAGGIRWFPGGARRRDC